MVAHVPIPPRKATGIVHDAQIAPPPDVLADFAEAGIVKAYARLTETIYPDGRREEVRDRRIPRELWRRIISEGKVDDVATGTVRLVGSPEFGGGPKVTLIGIRFDDQSVRSIAAQHGSPPPSAPPSSSSGPSSPPAAPAAVPAEPSPAPSPAPSGAAAPIAPKPAPSTDLGPLFSAPPSSPAPAPKTAIQPGAQAVSVDQAASALNVGRTKLYDMAAKGELKIRKIGRRSVISVDEIDRLLGKGK